MPNGGLPNCLECKNRTANDICNLYGIEVSPYLLCRKYKHWNDDANFDEHISQFLEPFQLGVVYWIHNKYGATQDNPLPAYKMLSIRHLD